MSAHSGAKGLRVRKWNLLQDQMSLQIFGTFSAVTEKSEQQNAWQTGVDKCGITLRQNSSLFASITIKQAYIVELKSLHIPFKMAGF